MRNGIVNSVRRASARAWEWLRGAPTGRVYQYDPTVDELRSTLTKKLTFEKLDTILRNADDGLIDDALQLFDEIERRDARVKSVSGTRRRALTGLAFQVVSAADVQEEGADKKLADEAAAFVRDHIDQLLGFRTALRHMAGAIGTNLAVVELVWEYGALVDLVPIPPWRLTMKPQESLEVRVITAEERTYGVVAAQPKFVVHVPDVTSGSPVSKALMGPQTWLYLFKRLSQADWGTFCEIYGMPARVGKYHPSASDAEKKQLQKMLAAFGSNAWMMISDNIDVAFKESAQRGTAPYEAFINYLDRAGSILWLGGNLGSDTTGGTGTFAAAEVQDRVRDDLLDDDIENEGLTVREQIFAPMVAFQFPGREVPVPYFQRQKPEDSKAVAELVGVWQGTGLPIPLEWARSKSGIPKPTDGEALLERPDAFEEGIREGIGASA